MYSDYIIQIGCVKDFVIQSQLPTSYLKIIIQILCENFKKENTGCHKGQ